MEIQDEQAGGILILIGKEKATTLRKFIPIVITLFVFKV